MKKIYKKKDEGVSPVIATILMVAMSVVLAAVLYVMVGGIDTDTQIQKTGQIESAKIKSADTVEITFGTFSGKIVPLEYEIILEDSNGTRIKLAWPYAPDAENFAITTNNPAITAIYRDFNPGGNEINSGDSIVVEGLESNMNYSIAMVDLEGNEVKLNGDVDFTTP